MKGEERRDRLAHLNLERIQRPPAQGWRAVAERARDNWEHFFAFAGWEKTAFIAGALVALVIGLGVTAVLFRNASSGGGERQPSASLPEVRISPTATTARPTPTTVLVSAPQVPTAAPTVEPNRNDCDAIRGTDYQSEAEHTWFLAHCTTPTAPTEPPVRTVPPVGGGGPTATPVPTALTSGQAASMAADWISLHTQYRTSAGSCTPINAGSHWVVTCQGTPSGCSSSGCQVAVSVCAFANPPRVVPSAQC